MPTFLTRYQNGEREQVWADLNSLGPNVRGKEYIDDAYTVAQETMRRARHNVETLIVRLEKLGYEFLTANKSAQGSLRGLSQAMEMMKAVDQFTAGNQSNPHVGALRQRARGMVASPMLGTLIESLQRRAAAPAPVEALKNPDVFTPPGKRAAKDIQAFEKSIGGPLPLSLRAWCEIVGSVSLIGSHPVLCFRETSGSGPMSMMMNPAMFAGASGQARLEQMRSMGLHVVTEIPAGKETPLVDPLVVEGDPAVWLGDCEAGETQPYPLAPDDLHKADISGDAYYMELPNGSADAPFLDWHKGNFVGYLRIAFRWGGFPGWERYPDRPDKELAYLAEGLLEI